MCAFFKQDDTRYLYNALSGPSSVLAAATVIDRNLQYQLLILQLFDKIFSKSPSCYQLLYYEVFTFVDYTCIPKFLA